MCNILTTILLGVLAFIGASPAPRIIGGADTYIEEYPFAVAVLLDTNDRWMHFCGGTIINNRSFLSAASCYWGLPATQIRGRVGSSSAHRGGEVHDAARLILHPSYTPWWYDSDIAVVRVRSAILFGPEVRPASIAGPNYVLPDDTSVWVIGWGEVVWQGKPSEQLRHVEVWTVDQATCTERHAAVTDNMTCAGALDVGGRDACTGDTGGPLLHNNVVVGVTTTGYTCGSPARPSLYTRVPRFVSWILENA